MQRTCCSFAKLDTIITYLKKLKLLHSDKCYIFTHITFPNGNFFKKASVLLVSPNTNPGATFTLPPAYWAAIRTLYARKFSGYVYNVCKERNQEEVYRHSV